MNARVLAPPRRPADRFDDLLGRRVSMRALALLRVLAGPAVLLHLWPFISDAMHGRVYRDAFYEPYASWYPELPDALYIGLLGLAAVAAPAASPGVRAPGAAGCRRVRYSQRLRLCRTYCHNHRPYP